MHTNHPDEPGPGGELWNSVGHHSFHVVFQRTRQESDGGGVKPPAPFRFEVWPTEFRTVTQAFGANPQNYQRFGLPGHEGLDIQASPGSKVFCVAPGQVKMVHLNPDPKVHAYGIHVRVSHADNYETIYAHLQSAVVQPGQQVVAGQLLGLADNTGNSLGDHLHITLKHHGESSGGYPGSIVDPTPFLVPLLTETTGRARDMGPVRVAEKLGLNCNAPTDPNGGITPRVADPRLIADTGVRWVRVNFILHPAKTPTDPAWVDTYRRIVRGLRDQGLKIYGLVGVEAAGRDPGNEFREEPANSIESDWIRQYAANFRLIVQQFRDDVEVFESFNEPNNWHHVDKEWKKAWIHPAWFAVMLQRVYEAVRDLDVTLVSGPLLSTPHGNDAADYLPKVYDAGKRRFGWGNPGVPVPFHGVGFHPYVLGDSAAPRDEIPARYEEYMAAFRRVITTKESGLLRPIYLSELGFQNAEDRQVECMKVGLDCALKDPSVALCFWYGMQDDVEKYGLYRIDGLSPQHRKPVYEPFVSLARDPRKVPIAAMRPVSPVNAARYVGEFDQVPDGTVLPPGRAFSKTWRLANTGTTTWGDGYRFLRVGGPSLGALASVRAPVCAPGGSADLTVAFAAPPDAGEYTSFWQLADPAGNPFSPKVWAQIRVQAMAAPKAAAPGIGLARALPGSLRRLSWPPRNRRRPLRWASSTPPTGCACWPPRPRRTPSRRCGPRRTTPSRRSKIGCAKRRWDPGCDACLLTGPVPRQQCVQAARRAA